METITLDSLKSFTVDGKEYPFLALQDWELNDCCLFEETAGIEYQELLGQGALSPKNLRAAMYVIARHHGLDVSLEEAGRVKLISFMQALGEQAAEDAAEGGAVGPPARAAQRPRKSSPRRTSSVRSKR